MIMIILIVSLGVLVFIMVFCFAKRQITRFALKSGKSPHEPIGQNAPKALLLEIERRLKRVKDIAVEPQLIAPEQEIELQQRAESTPQIYYYRMKALDSLPKLYSDIKKCNPNATKKVGIPLRVFLFEQRQAGCLEGIRLETIEKFCSLYDHARHDPKIFTLSEYTRFNDILRLLQNQIQQRDKRPSHSPATPGHVHPGISNPSFKKMNTTGFSNIPAGAHLKLHLQESKPVKSTAAEQSPRSSSGKEQSQNNKKIT
ncbi:hypothetical protein HELRODRAFT_190234 [Helobdella robusta]|uniref:Uncharacterized protein n=1 Tax=Helobdella robusta TaxID=6412 RepID=T1FRS9_HELRO|nr:hypothetical protein HELRODRAFT_190234 [Helobdella robusta]ESO10911.1 hypothetical protein HELRODRAFT_190234 [Helobdella robusta]